MPHIFERYYRADYARASSASTGLGLAIVRAIMQLHGGDVSVASVPGARTTFSLQLLALN
jgi:two-component system heavy metal sensor histidine kinase CusS